MNIQRISELPDPPQRPEDSHKGTFGKVLIIAGSPGMSGAACLAGAGALRSGAGLVFLAVPSAIQSIVATVNPCYLTIPLEFDADANLTEKSEKALLQRLPEFDAVAIGPGCGQQEWFRTFTHKLYQELPQTLIVDADALNVLATADQKLPTATGPRILTPHPGEFSRLTGLSMQQIEQQRETRALEFSQANNVVLILKGAGSIITDGKRLAVNNTGNSGMATGGTGDVLTGILTALAGQKMEAFAAAQLAAWLHGLAGDLAAQDLSEPALIAADLPDYLPDAWLRLLEE